MLRAILNFFDKLEDHVRGWFSHYPILYAIAGGIGIVLFWRGVWHTTDYMTAFVSSWEIGQSSPDLIQMVWWDGPLSFVIGTAFLLVIGVFVSNFIGNEIIITGLRGEKKLTEKTEKELRTEVGAIAEIKEGVEKVSERLISLETDVRKLQKSAAPANKKSEVE